ncbi:phosphotransferase family protein [Algoriphagus sediminis]|uniref:Phosphotransferase family protein n=1 Tax=Algoriphagus sediminis TaxID=3057113 RepID=A0ABT7YAR9_9BACT|nr:phosphotransferase family protein [Algoriphagus sediminis]MDN3203615.1 phosphotransferase family protein [Algoriphagus sediminis]
MTDQMDLNPLRNFLADHFEVDSKELAISQFKGGFSNLTFLAQIGQKSIVLRRPPFGEKISKAHDMKREFSVLQALKKAGYRKIPNPIFFQPDESIFGAPFFAMEFVDGVILRNKFPELKSFSVENFRKLSQDSIDVLIELHQLELDESGLGNLGKPEGYVERQVEGWSQRYFRAKTDEIQEVEKAIEWLLKNIPKSNQLGFIHNDYKYDNVVLDRNSPHDIKAILDWEMATVGNPLMDLGTSLAYWAQSDDPEILKMFNLTHLPGNFSREEVVDYYFSKSDCNKENMVFYYVFGLIKVGVIAQQIYKRFKMGHANDPRFAALIQVVQAAGMHAIKSIETDKI